jgi:glutamate dehydrogenase
VLDETDREAFAALVERLETGGASAELAARAAGMGIAFAAFDVVEIAEATTRQLEVVIEAYFRAGSRFSLSWLRDRILELPRANRWQALARASLRDDVSVLQRSLTIHVLLSAPPGSGVEEGIDAWASSNAVAVERYLGMLADIKASRSYDLATLPVALREARNLLRGI